MLNLTPTASMFGKHILYILCLLIFAKDRVTESNRSSNNVIWTVKFVCISFVDFYIYIYIYRQWLVNQSMTTKWKPSSDTDVLMCKRLKLLIYVERNKKKYIETIMGYWTKWKSLSRLEKYEALTWLKFSIVLFFFLLMRCPPVCVWIKGRGKKK